MQWHVNVGLPENCLSSFSHIFPMKTARHCGITPRFNRHFDPCWLGNSPFCRSFSQWNAHKNRGFPSQRCLKKAVSTPVVDPLVASRCVGEFRWQRILPAEGDPWKARCEPGESHWSRGQEVWSQLHQTGFSSAGHESCWSICWLTNKYVFDSWYVCMCISSCNM